MEKHLRVVAPRIVPWIFRINDHECNQILCELIKYLSKSLNFTYNLIETINDRKITKSRSIVQIQRNVSLSWKEFVLFIHDDINFHIE